MHKNELDILSEYYQYELSYLRSVGSDFAHRFPKIARRLDISNSESSDPHVERMVESFAFLTGKLQKQIDDQFPEIAHSLLNVLYEPLVLQTPACAMMNFLIDPGRCMQTPGFVIPRHTQLQTYSTTGDVCYFRTSHDLELWPLEIQSAQIVQKENIPSYYSNSTYYLKINLRYYGVPSENMPTKLRFYMIGDELIRSKLYAALFLSDKKVLIKKNDQFQYLSKLSPVGIDDCESLFPYPDTVHKGFRAIHEYFAFSEKYYGFDVILNNIELKDTFELYIPINNDIGIPVTADNFSLSAVPTINLFDKVTDPIRMDYKTVEYCLIPDSRRYNNHEIYSINKLVAVNPVTNDEIPVNEFFSQNKLRTKNNSGLYWTSRRKNSYMKDALGDDVYIAFTDLNFNPAYDNEKIFYAYTLCTNRHMAEHLSANSEFQIELSAPVRSIYCIEKPTSQIARPSNGEILWKLISVLSLNSLSFIDNGLQKLKDVLNIFAEVSNTRILREIDAIVSVETHRETRRILDQNWRGFIMGSNIEIMFDDSLANMGLPLSLAISKFLISFSTINTFSDVSIKSTFKSGVLRRWDQHVGIKNYL